MKVIIGVPSGDDVKADFSMSLSRMCLFTAKKTNIEIIGFVNSKSSIIEKGRHDMIVGCFKTDASHILMIDSDTTFPEDTLQVLASYRKEIVGCNYSTRRMPYKQTARDLDGNFFPEKMNGLQEASYVGTGCLFVDKEVFRKIGEPFFEVKWNGKAFIGEDYNFCNLAREKGFEVYCDLHLSRYIGHIGSVTARL